MVESSDRFFLRPRQVLAAKRIDFYDAINLVVYAKLPLITALRGSDLIAGYLFRDESGVIKQAMSFRGQQDLLTKYATHIDSLSYPVGPFQYEPLLDSMCRANEVTLPFFFHEHHLIVHRRRRAAMFARLYKELQSHVTLGDVTLQISDSEKTTLLIAGAWMTNSTLKSYLNLHGVLPWFDIDKNIESHAQLERVMLSDWLAMQTPATANSARQQTAPSEPSRSAHGLLSTYPMAGYVSLTKLPEVVSDADRKDSVHLGAEEEEHEQDRLQGELQQAELKPMYSEPAFIRTPSHVANPKEVIVNVVSPVVPEKEIYDERQLPSFLIAEKLLNKYFTRGASEAQPTSFEFQKAAIPSIVVEQPHLDSGLRTVPSTETFEGNESSDEELRYRFKTDRFKPLVRRIAEDAPAAAERDDLGNYSREDSQKELLDEPMMTKEEVAAFFNVSPNTIDNWRKSPDFPEAIQLGSGSLRWERAEIRHYKDLRKSK